MTTKELIALLNEKAIEDLFRSARAMPEEKLSWRCADTSRTVLEILQECAQSVKWPQALSSPGGGPPDADAYAKALAERESWTTVDACEKAAQDNWVEAKEYIQNYPEDDLDRRIDLPFAPGLTLSVAEILASPYWNMTYHLGQINFVQTMYGDREMH